MNKPATNEYHIITETKGTGLDNLMGSIKSEEESNNCTNQRRSPCTSNSSGGGTKRPLKEEDDSTISPSKSVKTEPGDGDEDTTGASSSEG